MINAIKLAYNSIFRRYAWQRAFGRYSIRKDLSYRYKLSNRQFLFQHAVHSTNLPTLYFLTTVLNYLKRHEEKIKHKMIEDSHNKDRHSFELSHIAIAHRIKNLEFDYVDFDITEEDFNEIDLNDPELQNINLFKDTLDVDFFEQLYTIRIGKNPLYLTSAGKFPIRLAFEHRWDLWRCLLPAETADYSNEYWKYEYGFFNSSVNLLHDKDAKTFNLNIEKLFNYNWEDFMPYNKFLNLGDGYLDHWFPPESVTIGYDQLELDLMWSQAYDDRWGEDEWRPEWGPEFEWDPFRYSIFVIKFYLYSFNHKIIFGFICIFVYFYIFFDIAGIILHYIKVNWVAEPEHAFIKKWPINERLRNWDGYFLSEETRKWIDAHKPNIRIRFSRYS